MFEWGVKKQIVQNGAHGAKIMPSASELCSLYLITNVIRQKMSGLIGKKIGMTSVYSAEGKNIPCTVIEAGPCVVTQIRKLSKDNYEAVQIAYDDKSEKHTSSSLLGHFKKAGTTPKRKLAEFKEYEGESWRHRYSRHLHRRGLGRRNRYL